MLIYSVNNSNLTLPSTSSFLRKKTFEFNSNSIFLNGDAPSNSFSLLKKIKWVNADEFAGEAGLADLTFSFDADPTTEFTISQANPSISLPDTLVETSTVVFVVSDPTTETQYELLPISPIFELTYLSFSAPYLNLSHSLNSSNTANSSKTPIYFCGSHQKLAIEKLDYKFVRLNQLTPQTEFVPNFSFNLEITTATSTRAVVNINSIKYNELCSYTLLPQNINNLMEFGDYLAISASSALKTNDYLLVNIYARYT